MNNHIDKPGLCEYSSLVLLRLIKDNSTFDFYLRVPNNVLQIGHNQKIARETNGIEAIINAMDIHNNNIDVYRYGCYALFAITEDNCMLMFFHCLLLF